MRTSFLAALCAAGLLAQSGDHRDWSVGASAEPVRLRAPIDFLAVGARWQAASPEAARIRIRVSKDGEAWSGWRELRVSADGPETESGEFVAELQFFGWDSRFLEYEADRPVRFVFIDPWRTPEDRFESIRAKRVQRAAASRPPLVSRTEWGSPDGENARQPVSYTTVTHLIVHHTADSFSGNDYAAWVRAIWRYHVFTNGWIDVGYNYLIAPDGTIFVGRAGGENVVGAHFSCQNGGTMGVALLGTYTSQQPTPQALESLKQLLAWRAGVLKLDPTATTFHAGMNQNLAVISGHRDGNNSPRSCTRTECPGNAFYPTLGEVARDVKALLSQPTILMRQDGESDPVGWEAGGLWHLTSRKPGGGANGWWFGRPDTGTYEIPGESPSGALTSPEFELSSDAELSFRTWHETEPDGVFFDKRSVEVRVNGGAWKPLQRLEGEMRIWSSQTLRIRERGRVQFRFRFDAGDPLANAFEGWYLDDIQVAIPPQ